MIDFRMNALISITEINSLYDQRPVIEKQASYAFVHPFAEALGGIVADIPVKFVSAVVFNIIFYFLASLVCLSKMCVYDSYLTLRIALRTLSVLHLLPLHFPQHTCDVRSLPNVGSINQDFSTGYVHGRSHRAGYRHLHRLCHHCA